MRGPSGLTGCGAGLKRGARCHDVIDQQDIPLWNSVPTFAGNSHRIGKNITAFGLGFAVKRWCAPWTFQKIRTPVQACQLCQAFRDQGGLVVAPL